LALHAAAVASLNAGRYEELFFLARLVVLK